MLSRCLVLSLGRRMHHMAEICEQRLRAPAERCCDIIGKYIRAHGGGENCLADRSSCMQSGEGSVRSQSPSQLEEDWAQPRVLQTTCRRTQHANSTGNRCISLPHAEQQVIRSVLWHTASAPGRTAAAEHILVRFVHAVPGHGMRHVPTPERQTSRTLVYWSTTSSNPRIPQTVYARLGYRGRARYCQASEHMGNNGIYHSFCMRTN